MRRNTSQLKKVSDILYNKFAGNHRKFDTESWRGIRKPFLVSDADIINLQSRGDKQCCFVVWSLHPEIVRKRRIYQSLKGGIFVVVVWHRRTQKFKRMIEIYLKKKKIKYFFLTNLRKASLPLSKIKNSHIQDCWFFIVRSLFRSRWILFKNSNTVLY